jgi:hypothetical protein
MHTPPIVRFHNEKDGLHTCRTHGNLYVVSLIGFSSCSWLSVPSTPVRTKVYQDEFLTVLAPREASRNTNDEDKCNFKFILATLRLKFSPLRPFNRKHGPYQLHGRFLTGPETQRTQLSNQLAWRYFQPCRRASAYVDRPRSPEQRRGGLRSLPGPVWHVYSMEGATERGTFSHPFPSGNRLD